MKEYRIVRVKGFSDYYKIQEKTGFWIFNWWENVYTSLTLQNAHKIMETIQERAKWQKENPVAKRDTVIETFKF